MTKIKINLAGAGLVPPGEYPVKVQRATLRDKIDGDSQYLHFDLTVVGGQYDGQALDTIASLRPDSARSRSRRARTRTGSHSRRTSSGRARWR